MAVEFLDEAPPAAAGGFEFVADDTAAPASPAEIKRRIADLNYDPTPAEFRVYQTAQDSRDLVDRAGDFLNLAGDALSGLWDTVVKTVKAVPVMFKDPEANNPLLTAAEGAARGTVRTAQLGRHVLGKVLDPDTTVKDAMGKFIGDKLYEFRGDTIGAPGSAPVPPPETLAKWREEFKRDRLPDVQYNVFMLDRIRKRGEQPPPGNISIINNQEVAFNPDAAEGASLVLDPAALIPFGKAMTPVKSLTRAVAAKTLEGAGRTFEWLGGKTVQAGTLPERAAGAAARAISGSAEAGAKATETVATGVAGISAAPVKVAGKTIQAGGEAATAIGRQAAAGPSRFGLFDRIAKDPKAPQWMRIAANAARPADPALNLAGAALEGAGEGAAIGTVLGAAADGEEGAAAGFGSGLALGAGGGFLGRLVGAGRYNEGLKDRDLAAWLGSKTPEEVQNLRGLNLSRDQAVNLADTERLARGSGGDVEFRYLGDKEFSELFGIGKGAQTLAGDKPVVFINTGYKGPRTVFHEVLHALDALEGFGPQRQALNRVLFDQTLPDGQVVSRGLYSAADVGEFTSQYKSRLNEAARAEFDLLPPEQQGAQIMSEARAEAFANLLSGKSGGAFLGRVGGLRSRVTDALLTADHPSMLGKMRRALESVGVQFDASGAPSELFVKNGKPLTNTPAVDAALRDYIRAKDQITRKLTAGDAEDPVLVVRPQDLLTKGNSGLVEAFQDSDMFAKNPDGSVRMQGQRPAVEPVSQPVVGPGKSVPAATPKPAKGKLLAGLPVLLSEREIRAVQSKRVDAMLAALDTVPDTGAAGSVRKKPNGAYEGKAFSKPQLEALLKLPDDVLSPAMKAKLMGLNELASQDGAQIILDYNAALKGGRYSSGIAPTTRAAVPLTFNISKAGNFYLTTLDTSHFSRKLGEWRRSKPKAFAPWGGDVDAFMRDVFAYLDNHVNGRSGSVNLDSDAAVAIHKKNVINDFFNVPKGKGNEDLNPVQLSVKGNKDNLIRSRRFDRINRITPGAGDRFPMRYELQKRNFLPVDPAMLDAASRAGATLLARGVTEPNAWGAEMVRMFGQQIKPILPTIRHHADGTIQRPLHPWIGQPVKAIGDAFPADAYKPDLLNTKGSNVQIVEAAARVYAQWPEKMMAADGSEIRLKHVARGNELKQVRHMINDNREGRLHPYKASWLPMVPETLRHAAVRLAATENNNRIYVRAYADGQRHLVFVSPDGVVVGQKPFTGRLVTQLPDAPASRREGLLVDWVRSSGEGGIGPGQLQGTPRPTPAGSTRPDNPQPAFRGDSTAPTGAVKPPGDISPMAIQRQLRAQAQYDLASRVPAPTALGNWLADTYLDALDKQLNRGSRLPRTAQLERVRAIAAVTTPQEMATALAALMSEGRNGAGEHLQRLATMKTIREPAAPAPVIRNPALQRAMLKP